MVSTVQGWCQLVLGFTPAPSCTLMSRNFHKHPGQTVPRFLPSSDFYKLLASDEIRKSIPYFRNTPQTHPSAGGWELEKDTLSQSSGLYPNPDRKQTNKHMSLFAHQLSFQTALHVISSPLAKWDKTKCALIFMFSQEFL